MSLSRCGRQYPDMEAARSAAIARTYKTGRLWYATSCNFGVHWHIKDEMSALGISSRPDPFPPPVAALLDARDEVCQRCGFSGRLERHHRRAKASGGSKARSHSQCTCNGVLLCRRCHEWVHLNPRKARPEGWTVLQSVAKPEFIGVGAFWTRASRSGEARWLLAYPTCDGRWNAEVP